MSSSSRADRACPEQGTCRFRWHSRGVGSHEPTVIVAAFPSGSRRSARRRDRDRVHRVDALGGRESTDSLPAAVYRIRSGRDLRRRRLRACQRGAGSAVHRLLGDHLLRAFHADRGAVPGEPRDCDDVRPCPGAGANADQERGSARAGGAHPHADGRPRSHDRVEPASARVRRSRHALYHLWASNRAGGRLYRRGPGEAVALLAGALRAKYCTVLELLPDGDALLLRAGVPGSSATQRFRLAPSRRGATRCSGPSRSSSRTWQPRRASAPPPCSPTTVS